MELPNPYRTTLLRAAQASLANVWVHAKADTAVVTLSFLGSEVAMDIYDDGAGFNPAGGHGPRRAPRRLGLRAEVAPGTGGSAGRQPGHRVRTRRRNGGGHPAPARGSPGKERTVNDIRVLLVDDHPVVRAGLRAMLSDFEGITVAAEASDGGAALAELSRLRTLGEPADVVLMDLQMGAGMDGVTATGRIKAGEAGHTRPAGAHPHHL